MAEASLADQLWYDELPEEMRRRIELVLGSSPTEEGMIAQAFQAGYECGVDSCYIESHSFSKTDFERWNADRRNKLTKNRGPF